MDSSQGMNQPPPQLIDGSASQVDDQGQQHQHHQPQQQQQQQQQPTTSCRECRRRRVKCDGAMPVCSICQKYRRHCLYDKHSRTRLTRKQLTILEERLEKAEALLRSHFSPDQLAEMMSGAVATAGSSGQYHHHQPQQSLTPAAAAASSSGTAATPAPGPAYNPNPAVPMVPNPASYSLASSQPVLGIGVGSGAGSESFELAPSVADDFEWDEHESSWSTYGAHLEAAPSDSPQSIMDGMASLSVGDRRGYLGAVSGAALLRQILSARRDKVAAGAAGGGPGDPASGAGVGHGGGAGAGPGVGAAGGGGGMGRGGQHDVDPSSVTTQEQLETLFHYQPDHSHQWYRAQSMLTRVAVENLIDAFFTYYHPTFPIVHEPTFRAQYAGTLPRPDQTRWNTLANIIASLGSFAGSNCTDATDLPIFQAAQKSLFADNLESGNLTLVQAFGLSATYLQKRNKPNTGYNYGGIALRMAIGLGLHKEFEEGHISALQMEIRRRVWWTLCVLDVGATITYGRPLNWPQAGVEAALPRNIHEEDLVSETASYPPEVDSMTLYTYLRVQSSYHLKTMGIYNRLITPPFPTSAELVAMDNESIVSWLALIPPYYTVYPPSGSKYALGMGITKWRYRNLRIVMYRPFLVRWALSSSTYDQQSSSSTESLAVARCLDAAKETIQSVEEYWMSRSHPRLAAWYVLYFLFHATLIPVHCLRHNPQHTLAPDWRVQIRSSMAVMASMTELSPNAAKCREVTLKLCWPHLHQDEEGGIGTGGVGDGSELGGRDGGIVGGGAGDSAFTHTEAMTLMPNLGDGETASMMNGYDAWCELMSSTTGGVPLWQWPNVDDQNLNFFYGAGSGSYQ